MTLPKVHRSGVTPKYSSRAAHRQTKAGDHLVEDQQGSHPVALRAQVREKRRTRRHEVHVGRHRLDQHGRHRLIERGHLVVGSDSRVAHRTRGDAGRPGQAHLSHAAAPGDQQGVRVAVVAAVELYDRVATGVAAGQSHRTHDRFGPRRDEAHLFESVDPRGHRFSQHHLSGRGRAERRTSTGLGSQGLDHHGVGVTEQRGAVGLDVVEVPRTLHVDDVGPLAALDGVGHPTHRTKRAHGRVDAARNHCLGATEPGLVRDQEFNSAANSLAK